METALTDFTNGIVDVLKSTNTRIARYGEHVCNELREVLNEITNPTPRPDSPSFGLDTIFENVDIGEYIAHREECRNKPSAD